MRWGDSFRAARAALSCPAASTARARALFAGLATSAKGTTELPPAALSGSVAACSSATGKLRLSLATGLRSSRSPPLRSRIRGLDMSTSAPAAGAKRRVGVGQMTAVTDLEQNFQTCQALVKEAVQKRCDLLSLPECFSFIGYVDGEAASKATDLSGDIMARYRQLAKDHGIWLSLGGFQETAPRFEEDVPRMYNTHVIIDSEGEINASYRKLHLFDVDIPNGTRHLESKRTEAGKDVCVTDSPVGRLGVTICYDVRFPELYQRLRFDHGAEVLLMPSAFMVRTGEAHWEVLMRARAIECQCYVVAAAQTGKHHDKRESYGDSIIIDPWGTVVARMEGEKKGVVCADIDLEFLHSLRLRMPIDKHRRPEVYCQTDR